MAKKDEGTGKKGMAVLARELSALHNMTVKQLRAKYEELFGEPTASNNRDYLRKKVAWRIQEQEHGGLSDRAKDRVEELLEGRPVVQFPVERVAAAVADAPEAVEPTVALDGGATSEPAEEGSAPAAALEGQAATEPTSPATEPARTRTRAAAPGERDPRLPAAGSVITKTHKGVEHSVKILDDGFDYQGVHYKSLSAIAKAATGQIWNGFLFFGLVERKPARAAQPTEPAAAPVETTPAADGEGGHE